MGAMGAIVAGAHFFLTSVVGVPEPAGFFVALAVVIPLWNSFIRRDVERSVQAT